MTTDFLGRVFSRLLATLTAAAALSLAGCTTTPRQYWESLKGEGFPEWSDKLGASVRGSKQPGQSSGFFTDRRSEQIERNLGGF